MHENPLISIGIPTYNRPEGLKRALQCITSQDYRNCEIIISDNNSKNEEVRKIVIEFKKLDPRILFFEQKVNIGIVQNFLFVLKKAKGDCFIWAADDDQWQGTDFLSNLVGHVFSNLLVFPDAVIVNENGLLEYPLKSYENCLTPIDYTRVLCSEGVGHPVYGLFNLELFNSLGLKFKLDEDLSYYQEGTFLHSIFLKGPIKYLKDAKVLYNQSKARTSSEKQLEDFFKYFNRVMVIYSTSDLDNETKTELINEIFRKYEFHINGLYNGIAGEKEKAKISGLKR